MLVALLPISLCVASLAAQDPGADVAAALLRGDLEAAAAAATAVDEIALRERLQAAVLPASQRPMAMLGVASRHRDDVQADLAILAGAAAVVVQRRGGGSLPDLLAWCEIDEQRDSGPDLAPAPVIVGLWRELQYRRAHGGDLHTLAEAEQLLREASVSRFGFEPVRVAPTATWTVPQRREELRLRAWRRQPGRGGWLELEPLGPADREVLLPLGDDAPIAALPVGDWLLELASTATCWRGVRTVEVSDLDVVALTDGARLALGAWRGGRPAGGGEWWFRGDRGERSGGAFAGGVQMFEGTAQGLEQDGELFVQVDGQRARVPLDQHAYWRGGLARWQAHVMVDRPIYRPGDIVHGRLVLREATYDGTGLDVVVATRAAANLDVVLDVLEGGDRVRLQGRTDAAGVWSFAVPLPELVGTGNVRMRLATSDEVVYDGLPCEIAMFRRGSLILDVDGPERCEPGEDASVTLRARWASGAPASGILTRAVVDLASGHWAVPEERHDLTTDAQGAVTLRLPLQRLHAHWARVTFTVSMPGGTRTLRHQVVVDRARSGGDADAGERRLQLQPPEVSVIGTPCVVRVLGPANGNALFVAGRGRGARAFALQFDAAGVAEATIVPTREQWPSLDLAVADTHSMDEDRVPILLRAATACEIELPQHARPGAAVECRVATGVPGTVVTAAVVDERVFAIAADRMRDAAEALRPTMPFPDWCRATSAPAMTAAELLESLLEDGRVPQTWFGGSLDGRGAFGGPAGAASPAVDEVRTEFRATAAFRTVVADADGVARVQFQLPDDLTTWRVTLVGVAPDGAAFCELRQLHTRLPLAAEPVLPRVLRAGDLVQMPIAVDRAAGAGTGDVIALAATPAGDALAIELGEHELKVEPGSAATAAVALRGVVAGTASLEVTASLGELADRSRRTLAVHADAVLRPVSVAALGEGEVVVACPADLAAGSALQVSVLGGSRAAWSAIDRRLQLYPYGCVEQTLSKLLPFCAAVRGARAHGATMPTADEEFERRLRAGFARLVRLQYGRGGAFSFWPGSPVDPGMTALVLHGLVTLREGGVDPARFGLVCDATRQPFAEAIARVIDRSGAAATAEEQLEVELAAACLRFDGQHEPARAAVAAAVAAPGSLPAGLLARCGLALADAGERVAATTCLQRLTTGDRVGGGDDGFPGEDPLAARALRLELQAVLAPDAPSGELAADVLLACLNGDSTTYAQGCALAALALALPPREGEPFAVRLSSGVTSRDLQLSPENGFTSELRLPAAARCAVSAPTGEMVVLRVAGNRAEPGSQHRAWSAPLVVERALCRRRADASAADVQRGLDLVPVAVDTLRAGELVWLRLRVRSPQPLRYVVLDCPLPAGFEPAEDLPWFERFDDRLAMTCWRVHETVTEFVVPLVPTLVGTMVWPPATAAPMYASGLDGGTAGDVLTVLPAALDPMRRSEVTCFAAEPRVVRPSRSVPAATPFEGAIDTLREAYEGADATALHRACDDAMAACGGAMRIDAVAVLYELTELLEDLLEVEPDVANDARRQVYTTLVERQRRCLLDVLAAFERSRSAHEDLYHVDELVHGLRVWQDRDDREALLGRVLEIAVARRALPSRVLDEIDGPVEDEHLRAVLLSLLLGDLQDEAERLGELLPAEDLEGLPATAVLALGDIEWPAGTVRRLLETPLGRAELRRRLGDVEFVTARFEALRAELPEAMWEGLSLPAFAVLRDHDGFDVVARLARSGLATADLQRELCAARDLRWQADLALALQRRGVRDFGGADPGGDPFCVAWQRALALGERDATGALQVLDALADHTHADERLTELLHDIVLRGGTLTQFAHLAPDLDHAGCARLFAKLDSPARRELLASITEPLWSLPDAWDTADGAALWAYGERFDELDDVVEALSRTVVGLRFAERRIAAIEDAALRESLRHDLRSACGLDPRTGLPPEREPWLPLLRAVARGGVPPTWSAEDRLLYDRLRRLRGVR